MDTHHLLPPSPHLRLSSSTFLSTRPRLPPLSSLGSDRLGAGSGADPLQVYPGQYWAWVRLSHLREFCQPCLVLAWYLSRTTFPPSLDLLEEANILICLSTSL